MDYYHHQELKIFSGNANPELSKEIARLLNVEVGKATVEKFSNGETSVVIGESIRSMDVYLIEPTCACPASGLTVNDSLMELLIMADAFKRASCKRLVAVIPFFGYARQSKKHKSRTPITAKLVANMMETAGIDRIITLDLHASQIQGFFNIPVDNLFVEPLIVKYIKKRIPGDNCTEKVVVAPGVGGVKRAKSLSDKLDCELVILHKEHNKNDGTITMTLVGDVNEKIALIIDDIADTCETLQLATNTILEKGAKQVHALVSHGVLSGDAITRINNSALSELVISNSIPSEEKLLKCEKLKVINVAPLLAEAIRRTHHGESLSTFF